MRMLGLTTIVLAAGLVLAGPARAQNIAAPADAAAATTNAAAPAAAAAPAVADPTRHPDGSVVTPADPNIGQPGVGLITPVEQVTPNGRTAVNFHDYILMPLIVAICLLVLALLIWVAFRYRAGANPTPSKTSHNTTIEVIWTLLPVLILILIAIPSIRLLAAQFKPAPDGAITLKAIGNQWYWSYEYPDNGGIQLTSNMLKEKGDPSLAPGARFRTDADGPRLLATDERVVLPVGVPIRLITTAQDVIHSWAIPAFWIKIDAVPGKLNETSFIIEKPGIYFGVCSELCGARHAYMPITVEAVSPAVFAQWVASKGGTMPGAKKPSAAAIPQPGSDASDKTAPANAQGPVENVTVAPATTNQAATATSGAGNK